MVSLRHLGIAATIAGVLAVIHAPFHSAAYLATDEGASGDALLPWAEPFREILPVAFDFSDTWGVYRAIGAFEPFVLAGMLAGLWILHRSQAASEGGFTRSSFWAVFSLWSVFTAATLVEYLTSYREQAFLVGFPALLLSLAAFIAYGIAIIRARLVPGDIGWALIGGAVLFIPLAASFGHIAMALVALNVALVRMGVFGLRANNGGTAPPIGTAVPRPIVRGR